MLLRRPGLQCRWWAAVAWLTGCAVPNPSFDGDRPMPGAGAQDDGDVGTSGAATTESTSSPVTPTSDGGDSTAGVVPATDGSDVSSGGPPADSTGASEASTTAATSTSNGTGTSEDPTALATGCLDDTDCAGDQFCCTADQCLGFCMSPCSRDADCDVEGDLVCRHEYWFPACTVNTECTDLLGPGFQCQHPCGGNAPLHCQPI
ncbi:MAG: hypothetical protein AAF721_13065 [Myxococcota bacterium]